MSTEERLDALREARRTWNAVRADRRIDYRRLKFTEEELEAADGNIVVAAYMVRDERLARTVRLARELKAGTE